MRRFGAAISAFFILCAMALACNFPSAVSDQGNNSRPGDTNAPNPATATNTFTPTPLAVTWNHIGLPTGAMDINSMLVHPSDENLWFAVGHPGEDNMVASLYRSTDAGSTWQSI